MRMVSKSGVGRLEELTGLMNKSRRDGKVGKKNEYPILLASAAICSGFAV